MTRSSIKNKIINKTKQISYHIEVHYEKKMKLVLEVRKRFICGDNEIERGKREKNDAWSMLYWFICCCCFGCNFVDCVWFQENISEENNTFSFCQGDSYLYLFFWRQTLCDECTHVFFSEDKWDTSFSHRVHTCTQNSSRNLSWAQLECDEISKICVIYLRTRTKWLRGMKLK